MGYIDHSKMPSNDYVYRKGETTAFVSDYKSCLLELSPLERRVLRLWYDTNFQISHSPEEISEKTGLSTDEVRIIYTSAIHKVRNNPKMKKYRRF
ncbi:MAG: hypothetical protein IKZ96_00525 [Bacilli bacterium]|nr:hypothetical protein [Bacilli bacterium]